MMNTYYPWQNAQWDHLQARLESGKLPHALLLSGAEGVGKTDFAHRFTQMLLCRTPRVGQACGVCPSCVWFGASTHPDFYRVQPEEEGKQIKIEQVRELIEFLALRPHSATRKVAMLLNAEQMNSASANSLLKSLEEPPSASLLILVTANPSMLLPTIRSRCQNIRFTLPDAVIAIEWLRERSGAAIAPDIALALASGSPLRAMSLSEKTAMDARESLINELEKVTKLDLDPILAAKQWLKLGIKPTLYWLTSWIQDMVRLKLSAKPPLLNNPDLIPRLTGLSQRFTLSHLLQLRDALLNAERFHRGNMNASLCLEEWLFMWLGLTQQRNTK